MYTMRTNSALLGGFHLNNQNQQQNLTQGQSQYGNSQRMYQPTQFTQSTYSQNQTPNFGANEHYQAPQAYRTQQYFGNQQNQQNQNNQQYQQNQQNQLNQLNNQGQYGMHSNQYGTQQNQNSGSQFGSYSPSQGNMGYLGSSMGNNAQRSNFSGNSSFANNNTNYPSPQSYRLSNYYGNQQQNQNQQQSQNQGSTGFYNQGN